MRPSDLLHLAIRYSLDSKEGVEAAGESRPLAAPAKGHEVVELVGG